MTTANVTRNGNDKLWELVNEAIHAKQWGPARRYLDDLNYFHREAATDALAAPEGTPDYVKDRINLWNSNVAWKGLR